MGEDLLQMKLSFYLCHHLNFWFKHSYYAESHTSTIEHKTLPD